MVTIKDVARLAKVSIFTVSNVMNNRTYSKAETRDRVTDAIKKLGYRPNLMARALRSKRSRVVVLALSTPQGPSGALFFAMLVTQALAAAYNRDYRLSVLPLLNVDQQRKEIEALQRGGIAGLLLAPIPGDLSFLLSVPFPLTVIGSRPTDFLGDVVEIDYAGDVARLVKRMANEGLVKIGLVGRSDPNEILDRRRAGYLEAMRAAGFKRGATFIFDAANRDEVETALSSALDALIVDEASEERVRETARGRERTPKLGFLSQESILYRENWGERAVALLMERINGDGEKRV